jgi:hypothetical protein
MTKRFVVIVDDAPKASREAITEALKDEGVAWWHWFQSGWLLKDRKERSAAWWRTRLRKASNAHMLVLEIADPARWSGFGNKSAFVWLHTIWDKD